MKIRNYILTLLIVISFSSKGQNALEATLKQIPFRQADKWGFSNSKREILIEPKYDRVDFFNENYSIVHLNSSYGLIDSSGKEVLKLEYYEIDFDYSSNTTKQKKVKNQNGNIFLLRRS